MPARRFIPTHGDRVVAPVSATGRAAELDQELALARAREWAEAPVGGAYRVGGAVSPPTVLTHVRPSYTEEALHTGIQGSVMLELIVRENGVPDTIRVVRSLDPGGLDVKAVEAVRQWRFRPGRIDGAPVDVLVTVMVNFHLY